MYTTETTSPEVVVVGHVVEDIINLLDGSTVESIGGMVSYATAALSTLGAKTGLVSNVGQNYQTENEAYFDSFNVDCTGVRKDSEYTTRGVLTHIDHEMRDFVIEHKAGPMLPKHIPNSYLDAKLFYFGPVNSFSWKNGEVGSQKIHTELPLETYKHVAENSNARIMLDAQGYTRVCDEEGRNHFTTWDDAKDFYQYVDILKVNDAPEAEMLTGLSDPVEAAKQLYSDLQEAHVDSPERDEIVIVTQGEKGALLVTDNTVYHIDVAKPDAVVDTTGAGDSFGAGFADGIVHNKSIIEAAQQGIVVSSFVVEKAGVEALPSYEQVQDRLKKQNDRIKPQIVDIVD